MEFKYELENGCLTIRVPKELDHHCATQLRAEADLLIDSYRVNKLVFDFAGTEFMDSSGIGMLLTSYKSMRFMGGTILVIHAGERMRRILTLSGLDKFIDIYQGLPRESDLI